MNRLIILVGSVILASCSSQGDNHPGIGMANPASVYCHKLDGKLEIAKEASGEVGYCNLPNGEKIEEWTLYRRDNK